jgi:fructoselysine 6-kinase
LTIVSIGEIAIDYYKQQNLKFIGGIGLNFAVNAKRSGEQRVSMVSCVGDGIMGSWALETLLEEKVDISHISIKKGKTAEIEVEIMENAERFFPAGGYKANVLGQLCITNAIQSFITGHDIMVTQFDGVNENSIVSQILKLQEDRTKCVVDFGDCSDVSDLRIPSKIFSEIDLAFFSGNEDTVELLKPIIKNNNLLIVVTMGTNGSFAITKPKLYFQPAIKVSKMIDTNGCGDAFQAAFTNYYFRKKNISEALFQGANQAAKVLQHYGAFSQVPRSIE